MIQEFSAPAELARLLFDPVFQGDNVPRGDGKIVMVIPGLFGNDLYLEPLRYWLRRIGYSPASTSLWVNAGCMHRLEREILARITRRTNGRKDPIALIGHSRGGILARAIAGELRERVSHVVTLGAPIAAFRQAVQTHEIYRFSTGELRTMIVRASALARRVLDPGCRFPSCECEFLRNVADPLHSSTAFLSIFSNDDVIAPPDSITAAEGESREVKGGHTSLVYNASVYRIIGDFLGAAGEH